MSHKQPATVTAKRETPGDSTTKTSNHKESLAPEQTQHGHIIETLKVRPGQQSHIDLGVFSPTQPPKGFVVELNPDPTPDDSVVTKVLSSGTGQQHNLTLHIANYGANTVTAEVQQLL